MIFDRLLRASAPTSGGTRIVTSAQLAEYLGSRSSSKAGAAVTPETAMAYASVFACVRVLAESVGQLPLHLMERVRDREKRKATSHPLYSLLHDAPSEHQTSQELIEFLVGCMALRGNAYAFVNRAPRKVLELTPLHPDGVTPRPGPDGGLVYDLRQPDGSTTTHTAREILHLRLFSLDGVMGVSPIRYAREAVGLGIATEEHGARLFSNGARPGGVLQAPGPVSDKAYDRIRTTFEERHQGAENAGRVALLEEGMTWQSVGMSSDDAQFLETRKFQRSEVAGIFRVPPHMIGDLERATFSNIEHQSLSFVRESLMPYLRRIEQRISLQLLGPDERKKFYAKFNVDGLLRGDTAARSAHYREMFGIGVYSPNDIREFEDKNPREGGDVYLIPLNMGREPVDHSDASSPQAPPTESGGDTPD